MRTTIVNRLPLIPGLSGNVINGSFNLDFPNNVNITYTTIQDNYRERKDVGNEFLFKKIPLTIQSISNKLDLTKEVVYSTIQIGMKEFNNADPKSRREYEALEKELKEFSKQQLKTKTNFRNPAILSVERRYNAPRPEYVLEPTFLTFSEPKINTELPDEPVILENDPERAAIPPQSGVISDFSMNYDVSGPTKTYERSVFSQGLLREQEVSIYGYAYSSSDPGVVAALEDGRPYYGASLQSFWRIVEYFKIIYEYNNDLYTGYTKTGYKYTRYAQEQNLEVYESENPAVKRLYSFFKVPIFEKEALQFELLPNDSDSIPKCITKDFYDPVVGKMVSKFIPNPDYKPALFMAEKNMYSRCFAKSAVPEDAPIASGIENQMITTGQENKVIEKIDIIDNTGNSATSTYRVYRYQESSQDADFKNNLKISGSETFLGLPPQVSYVNTKESASDKNNNKHVIYANTNLKYNPNMSSIDYPQCNSISCAFDKFKSDEDYNFISEMRGHETIITLAGFYEAYPGNTVRVSNYGGILRSINYTFECIDKTRYKIYTNMILIEEPDYLPSDLLKLTDMKYFSNNDCPHNVFTGNIEAAMENILKLPGRN